MTNGDHSDDFYGIGPEDGSEECKRLWAPWNAYLARRNDCLADCLKDKAAEAAIDAGITGSVAGALAFAATRAAAGLSVGAAIGISVRAVYDGIKALGECLDECDKKVPRAKGGRPNCNPLGPPVGASGGRSRGPHGHGRVSRQFRLGG